MAASKNILIISPNFSGGGLEVRVNTLIDILGNNYNFSLCTATPKDRMKIPPSPHIKNIISYSKAAEVASNFDIIDIHPFNSKLIDHLWNGKSKFIYTLHGELSLRFDDTLHHYHHIISVSNVIAQKFLDIYPEYKNKISIIPNFYLNRVHNTYNTKTKDLLINIPRQIPTVCLHSRFGI